MERSEIGVLAARREHPALRYAPCGLQERHAMHDMARQILLWLRRTPVQTFILCPLAVIVFELVLHGGRPAIVPWGLPLMAWGYGQYLLVGRYRLPSAGRRPRMEVPPP